MLNPMRDKMKSSAIVPGGGEETRATCGHGLTGSWQVRATLNNEGCTFLSHTYIHVHIDELAQRAIVVQCGIFGGGTGAKVDHYIFGRLSTRWSHQRIVRYWQRSRYGEMKLFSKSPHPCANPTPFTLFSNFQVQESVLLLYYHTSSEDKHNSVHAAQFAHSLFSAYLLNKS